MTKENTASLETRLVLLERDTPALIEKIKELDEFRQLWKTRFLVATGTFSSVVAVLVVFGIVIQWDVTAAKEDAAKATKAAELAMEAADTAKQDALLATESLKRVNGEITLAKKAADSARTATVESTSTLREAQKSLAAATSVTGLARDAAKSATDLVDEANGELLAAHNSFLMAAAEEKNKIESIAEVRRTELRNIESGLKDQLQSGTLNIRVGKVVTNEMTVRDSEGRNGIEMHTDGRGGVVVVRNLESQNLAASMGISGGESLGTVRTYDTAGKIVRKIE